MSQSGDLKFLKLLMVLGLWSLPALAQAQTKPAAAPTVGTPTPAAQQQKTPATAPAPTAAAANPSEYAGAEACQACHADIYTGWEKSPHWKQTYKEGGIAKHGCEDCHGAAASHVADPTDTSKLFLFEKASAKEIDARCLGCHAGGTQHMNAINSEHARNEVSCVACHSPHHGKDSDFLLVKSQPELCYSCHLAKKAEFDMPFHHRVNEGLIQCTDCHNPHGTVKPKQVRTSSSQDAVCFTCHTDKQGPFVFEHQPVKVDGCQSCHLVHGGPNPHMLKLSNVNLLCLQCHTQSSFSGAPGAPSFHNQASFFQSCVLCHSQVHGSNFDPTFFK
ncbi:MAG: DmsE family decaheme c-type cytochrome [Candidatus Acidiferrales bacterium]